MTEKIFELAQGLARTDAEDEAALRPLCQAAEEELTGRLRPGVTVEDCGDSFQLAAAMLALSGLAAAGAAGGVRRFSAGDVTVEEQSTDAEARAAVLRRQAERMLAGFLRDDGFAFRGVCG